MRFNFRKITAVLTSVAMIGSTIGVAAAANYPDPFIKSGAANVAIVYGTGAGMSVLDTLEAGNIQTDLQAKMSTTTSGTSATVSGEGIAIEQASNKLNLNNGLTDVLGRALTKSDLPTTLADGTFYNRQNTEYKYIQKFDFGNLTFAQFADSDYENKAPTLGFHITSNTYIANYTLDFSTDPESTVSSGECTDFEQKEITILGKNYFILDFKNTSTEKIILLDSASMESLSDQETKQITIGDTTYDVKIGFIASDQVILNINGVNTEKMSATGTTYGNTYKLSDGTYVGIRNINYDSKEGSVSSVDFSLGKGKLELNDGSQVKVNDKTVTDLYSYITTGSSGARATWQKLILTWIVDDENFLTPGKEMIMPSFEAIKFTMADTTMPAKEETLLQNNGDSSWEIRTTIKDGAVTIPFLYIARADSSSDNTGNITGLGQDADNKLATAVSTSLTYGANGTNEGFIASWASTKDSETYYLDASIRRDADTGINYTTIKNKVTDENVCTDLDPSGSSTCTLGNIVLTVGTTLYTERTVALTINSGGSFNDVYTEEGLQIQLPWLNWSTYNRTATTTPCPTLAAGTNQLNVVQWYNDSAATTGYCYPTQYQLVMSEEDKDGTLAQRNFNFTLTTAGTTTKVTTVSAVNNAGTGLRTVEDSDNYVYYVNSDLATKILHKTGGDADTANIEYHGGEVYANVFIADPSATVSGGEGSTTSTVTQLGTVTFKDTEVSSVSSKNLIVIGGSCINSVAAKLLGASGQLCTSAFTEKTGVGAGQYLIESFDNPYAEGTQVALLVAGYEAADTVNAATYLRNKAVDTTVGKKYIGTSATEATLQTATTETTTE